MLNSGNVRKIEGCRAVSYKRKIWIKACTSTPLILWCSASFFFKKCGSFGLSVEMGECGLYWMNLLKGFNTEEPVSSKRIRSGLQVPAMASTELWSKHTSGEASIQTLPCFFLCGRQELPFSHNSPELGQIKFTYFIKQMNRNLFSFK